MWPGVVFCDVMIEDKDVRLRVWLLDGGEVAWLKIVDGCVLKEVWGRGIDCGGCGWKDVGMVATR